MAGTLKYTPNMVLDSNGSPLSGALGYFYDTGTTTPVTVYADAALTIAHPVPLVANGSGVFPYVYTDGSKNIKVNVTDAAGGSVPGYPVDPAIFQGPDAKASSVAFTPTSDIPSTDVQAAIVLVNNIVNDPTPQLGGPLSANSFSIDGAKGADVASAAELLLLRDGNMVNVTGTTTITSIETTANAISIGAIYILKTTTAVKFTHHATNLILLGGADITTAAGDFVVMQKYASGKWQMIDIAAVNATAVWEAGTDTKPSLVSPAHVRTSYLYGRNNDRLHILDKKPTGTAGGAFTSGAWQQRDLNTEISSVTGSGLVSTLAYDAQTANFTVGGTLTGGTSGATALIVADTDAGATGTLKLVNISGTFTDNEVITDVAGGSADANGTAAAANEVYLAAGDWRVEALAKAFDVGVNQSRIYDVTGAALIAEGTSETSSATYNGASNSIVFAYFTVATPSIYRLEHYCNTTKAISGFGEDSATGIDNVYSSFIADRLS